jgi:hypothetical protein
MDLRSSSSNSGNGSVRLRRSVRGFWLKYRPGRLEYRRSNVSGTRTT